MAAHRHHQRLVLFFFASRRRQTRYIGDWSSDVCSSDRHGHLVSELAWASDGSLGRARVRLPDGTWLAIEPRATTAAPWGLADRLWRAERFPEGGDPPGEPLTVDRKSVV